MPAHARPPDRRGAGSLEFVFPHRNSPPVANASAIPNRQAVFMRGCRCCIKQISPRLCQTNGRNWLFSRHVAKRSRNGTSGEPHPNNSNDAALLTISALRYWFNGPINCLWLRADHQGPAGTGSDFQRCSQFGEFTRWGRRKHAGGGSFDLCVLRITPTSCRATLPRKRQAVAGLIRRPDKLCRAMTSANQN